MTTGSNITAVGFVTIQDKAQSLLGSGIASKGYGQTVLSSDVFTGNQITKAQWDALRYDIINIRYHQDGELPSIVTVNVGDVIEFGASSPNSNYDTLLETAAVNKFKIASSQSVVSSISTATTSTPWSSSAQCTLTVTFGTADEGRYFFNSGGKIRFTSSLSGGTSTPQYNAWLNFLNTVGTKSFGADTDPTVNYYTLTNSFQTYYQGTLSTPYSSNNYKLEAKTDVADNSSGTATVLTLRITLTDSYTDMGGGDSVTGTLSILAEELKASGTLVPSGSFTITSPGYSLSSISVS